MKNGPRVWSKFEQSSISRTITAFFWTLVVTIVDIVVSVAACSQLAVGNVATGHSQTAFCNCDFWCKLSFIGSTQKLLVFRSLAFFIKGTQAVQFMCGTTASFFSQLVLTSGTKVTCCIELKSHNITHMKRLKHFAKQTTWFQVVYNNKTSLKSTDDTNSYQIMKFLNIKILTDLRPQRRLYRTPEGSPNLRTRDCRRSHRTGQLRCSLFYCKTWKFRKQSQTPLCSRTFLVPRQDLSVLKCPSIRSTASPDTLSR